MNPVIIRKRVTEVILKAQKADEEGLKMLRKKIIAAIGIFVQGNLLLRLRKF